MYDWDEKPELNITPLVDVMLVLLAVLMVAAPSIVYEEEINLPQGSRSKSYQKKSDLTIKIKKNRKVYLGKKEVEFGNFADNFMLFTQSLPKDIPVYIAADKGVSYGDVVYILKSIKEAGFSKVSLITDG
jgi:biopolymer transport protein ExbD